MLTLDQLESDLRSALQAERLDDAMETLLRYRQAYDAAWAAIPEERKAQSPLPRRALDLMHWAHAMTCAIRSTLRVQRRAAKAARPYARAKKPHPGTWEVAG